MLFVMILQFKQKALRLPKISMLLFVFFVYYPKC